MDAVTEIFAQVFGGGEFAAPIGNPKQYGFVTGKDYAGKQYSRGDPIDQLYKHYPALEGFYTDFEKEYDPEPVLNWMKNNNYMLPVCAVIGYVLFVFVIGPAFLKNRSAFVLKNQLAVWNFCLSMFSFWGASRTVPWLLYRITHESFEDTVCISPHVGYGTGVAGLATQMFILSKLPELVDTVFLVLKKRDVIFLHWYHHITVLLYCWNSYVTESSAGLYFVAMNYTVHAFMYFYFFLMAIKGVPKWFNPFCLTVMQISQMIVGTSVVGACIYYHLYGDKVYNYKLVKGVGCNNIPSNLIAGGLMYASYLYLFLEFAVKKFFLGVNDYDKKPKTEAKTADTNYGTKKTN